MAKAVIIALNEPIPDTEQDKVVTLDIEGRPYTGKVSVILNYTPISIPAVPAPSLITISATGLVVVPPAP